MTCFAPLSARPLAIVFRAFGAWTELRSERARTKFAPLTFLLDELPFIVAAQ
jgi:hypothetical protein